MQQVETGEEDAEESKGPELECGQIRKVSPDTDSVLNSDAEQSQSSFSAFQQEQENPAGSIAEDVNSGQSVEEEKKDHEEDDLP